MADEKRLYTVKQFIVILSLFLIAAFTAFAGETQPWEDALRPAENKEQVRDALDGDDIEVSVKDGWVYVTTQKPVNVKIFTILGQLITSETIRPGTKKIHISSRGIYILRAGAITRRITI